MYQTSGAKYSGILVLLAAGTCIVLGLASIATLAVAQTVTAPRYIYGPGAQGYGYSQSPRVAVAARQPAAAAASNRPRTVGPGARNWATGNRTPLHRPWLRARD